MTSSPRHAFAAAVRESTRPAPWQQEPNVSCMACAVPRMTYEAVPMSPGTSTGWPTARYAGGTSGWPGPKARVAAEEAPDAYKDVSDVIDVCHGARVGAKVARLKPIGCVKG